MVSKVVQEVEAETSKNTDEKQFQIQQFYIKQSTFEAPNLPTVFDAKNWDPKMQFEISANSKHVKEDLYEVVLRVKVTADSGEQRAFTCDLTQAGLFSVKGFTEEERKFILSGACPNTLYAYARKALSDMTVNAGFPPLLLAPMNFEAVYLQEMQKQKNAGKGSSEVPESATIH
jgi:preprotein translocase subunit SecB